MDEFEQVYRKYSSLVYRYLLSLCGNTELAEELTAETFYRAYLSIGRFRGDCKIETWLCKIAKNALIKEMKRRSRHRSIDDAVSLEIESSFEEIFDHVLTEELMLKVERLKEPYKEVFKLRILGGLQYKKIAVIFGKSESWAKITFYRAKSKLIDMMGDINNDKL